MTASKQDKIRDMVKEIAGEEFAERRDAIIAEVQEQLKTMTTAEINKLISSGKTLDTAAAKAGKHGSGNMVGGTSTGFDKHSNFAEKYPEADAFWTAFRAAAMNGLPNAETYLRQLGDQAKGFKGRAISDAQIKAAEETLSSLRLGAGGILIPEDVLPGILGPLVDASVIFNMGMDRITMTGPEQTRLSGSAAVAAFGQPGSRAPLRTLSFKGRKLKAMKVLIAGIIERELAMSASENVSAYMSTEFLAAMIRAVEGGYIHGDGSENTIRGLVDYTSTDKGNRFSQRTSPDLDKITGDLMNLPAHVASLNVPENSGGYLMNTTVRLGLMAQRDDNGGGYAFRDELLAGTLFGYRVGVTNMMRGNLGTGGNESEILFAQFGHVTAGQWGGIEMRTSTEATFFDENNKAISLMQEDLMGIVGNAHFGLLPNYLGDEVAYLDKVTITPLTITA